MKLCGFTIIVADINFSGQLIGCWLWEGGMDASLKRWYLCQYWGKEKVTHSWGTVLELY